MRGAEWGTVLKKEGQPQVGADSGNGEKKMGKKELLLRGRGKKQPAN